MTRAADNMTNDCPMTHASRRTFLIGVGRLAGGLSVVSVLGSADSHATPAAMQTAIRKVVGEASLRKGKVTLDLPPIVENGNSVSLEVKVDSPMTPADHVKAVHVFNEKNPQPNVISVRLGPRAGFWSGLCLLTMLGTWVVGRVAMTDLVHCLCVTGAILAYSEGARAERPARHFTLGDHFFANVLGPSFPGHTFVLAAQAGWAFNNPNTQLYWPYWGCDQASSTLVASS